MVVVSRSHDKGNVRQGMIHNSFPTGRRIIERPQPRVKPGAMLVLSILLLTFTCPALAKPSLLDVFPDSPSIPELIYQGQLSFTNVYSPSGSQWAPGLDEREVFLASLKHTGDFDSAWEIRLGKGGQLYSIRGFFGETQAPQSQPNAHWVDQIFQLVGVNRLRNTAAPGHQYFIHQAGDYLDDPILKTTFYSPILASEFDAKNRSLSVLSWGQEAHIPNTNAAGLLYYERLKDLGSGVIEITYVVHNFGKDVIDYLNTPWGGVRKSVLPVTLASRPDGSLEPVSAGWDELKWIDLAASGGWIAWTRDPANPASPTLAFVAGKDRKPNARSQLAPARFRYGTGDPADDFEAFEFDPFMKLDPGAAMFARTYIVIGSLGKVQKLAALLTRNASWGPIAFDQSAAARIAVYPESRGRQTVLTRKPVSGGAPVFYTFAQPLPNFMPLFVIRDTFSDMWRLTTDPCELCTRVRLGRKDFVYKPYDGKVEYGEFLGYAAPKQYARRHGRLYSKLTDVITDRSYLPGTSTNKALRVVRLEGGIDKSSSSVLNSHLP